jgi:hypothetical protein
MTARLGRLLVALVASLMLALGALAVAGTAQAAGSCSTQQSHVATAKAKVAKDKHAVKKAQRALKKHHHKKAHRKALRRAKARLAHDQRGLHRAQRSLAACRNQAQGSTGSSTGTTGGTAGGTGNGTTTPPADATPDLAKQCTDAAASVPDPTGLFATGAAQFCGLVGQAGSAGGGGAPDLGSLTSGCTTLAAMDPTGTFQQFCDALGGGVPSLPLP